MFSTVLYIKRLNKDDIGAHICYRSVVLHQKFVGYLYFVNYIAISFNSISEQNHNIISTGYCKKDVTPVR